MISERAAKAILKATSNREHSPAGIAAYKRVCESWCRWFAIHIEETMSGNTRVKPKDVMAAYGEFLAKIGEKDV